MNLLSEVTKYRILSLVTNTIYIFSLYQTEAVSTTYGVIYSKKDLECTVLVCNYATGVRTQIKQMTSYFDVTFELT